jgi:gliding motility-associated lipoprotein GldH
LIEKRKKENQNFQKELKMLNRTFVFLFMAVLSACNNPSYLEFKNFKNGWDKSKKLEFNIINDNINTPKDIFFVLRHNQDYPFSNIFLISELSFENKEIILDTFEFQLANPKGDWLGEKKISVVEHMLPYKSNFILKDTNKLKIRTSMRLNDSSGEIENLPGIVNFGILID